MTENLYTFTAEFNGKRRVEVSAVDLDQARNRARNAIRFIFSDAVGIKLSLIAIKRGIRT